MWLLDAQFLRGGHDDGVALEAERDAELRKGAHDEVHVLGLGVGHAHLAAGDRAEREEGDDLVVVGADRDFGAVETVHAVDLEAACAHAADARAHRGERGADVLHVGLAGGVDQGGGALGEGGGHGEVFRGGDGHVVGPVARGAEAAVEGKGGFVAAREAGAEALEQLEVWIQFPDAERAALGVGLDDDAFEAVEQRGVE